MATKKTATKKTESKKSPKIPPAMWQGQIEMIKVADLKPYERNNKKHPKAQVEALAAFMTETRGCRIPIAIDSDKVIIAGHARVEAVKKLGWAEVPCIVHHDLSESEKKALRIADNRLAELAQTDLENLVAELKDIEAEAIDIAMIGFSAKELALLDNALNDEIIGEGDKVLSGKELGGDGSIWYNIDVDGSVRCLIGNFEFNLPPEVVEKFKATVEALGEKSLRAGARKWFVDLLSQ